MSDNETAVVAKPSRLAFLSKLSLRAQILIFATLFLGGVFVWTSFKGSKAKPTPKPTPTQQTAAAEQQAPVEQAPLPPQQRLPSSTPSAETMQQLSSQRAASADTASRDALNRAVGVPIAAATPKREDKDEAEELPPSKQAAGSPYSAKQGKGSIAEIFGIVAPPPPVTQNAAPQAATSNAQVGENTAPVRRELRRFAPFGRLVKCHLVNTIDSLTPTNTPVIAMTDEDVVWNGEIIIPVGTEVFTYVTNDPKIDAAGVGRLYDNGEWIMVLPKQARIGPNGREWIVRGRALNRRELLLGQDGSARAWGLDDMAPGFIGYTISTLDNEEIKQFAAAFFGNLANTAGNVLQTREPAPGVNGAYGATQPSATARNAVVNGLGAGTSAAMESISQRISEEIKKRGFYVRVPASSQFYLFIEQTLDPSEASVGLKLPSGHTAQPQKSSP